MMDFPPSLNFLSLQERLHDAWLLLWPLLFLGSEEDSVLSSDMGSGNDDDDDDEDEGKGEGDASSSSSSCWSHCFFFQILIGENGKMTFFS